MTATGTAPQKIKTPVEGSWRQVMEMCLVVGKDRLLKSLDRQLAHYQRRLDEAGADTDTHSEAPRLRRRIERQIEIMAMLRKMSDAEMRSQLEMPPDSATSFGVEHNKPA